ncbi:hypothetical protein GJ496_006096 [Pomphorhynchus laevis]|nr:hypothetical protein GJ496_006096 [Pomphorhynchus laevis]
MKKETEIHRKSVDFNLEELRTIHRNVSENQDTVSSQDQISPNANQRKRFFRQVSMDDRKLSNISINQSSLTQRSAQQFRNAMRKISTTVVDKQALFNLKDTFKFDEIIQSFELNSSNSISEESKIIRINVSGSIFEAYVETFEAHPNTLLGNEDKRNLHFISSRNEIFFDRCRRSFIEILSYYQNGEIRRPDSVCLKKFVEELRFYQLDNSVIQQILCKEKAIRISKPRLNKTLETKNSVLKQKLSNLLTVPSSSKFALCIFIIRILVQLYLITLFMFAPNIIKKGLNSFIYISEITGNALIFLDICLNLYCCPSKRTYLLSFYTINDIFSITSCILLIFLTKVFNVISELERSTLIAATRSLQLFRLLQLFRYSRSNITKALGRALRNSTIEIMSIFLIINILSIFFGSLLYFVESTIPNIYSNDKNQTNMIQTMWDGIWLAIITMTTVGYGDLYPHTYVGRVVAVICACFGQVIICMIIPIVSNLYQEYYQGRILEDQLFGSLYQQRVTEERQSEHIYEEDNTEQI